jgi:hypothetical protein
VTGCTYQASHPRPPTSPEHVVSSINDARRPRETGPFGETRVVLLTPNEVGNITGATAFCGPGFPGRPGGTVKYSYLSLPTQGAFPAVYISRNTEVFYTLSGSLSFRFDNNTSANVPSWLRGGSVFKVEPFTFIQIEPGVPFSIANEDGNLRAQSLAISVIAPLCPPSPFLH